MTTCQTCHGTGELVAVGNGRYIRLDQWSGDQGDLVDCPDCQSDDLSLSPTFHEIIRRVEAMGIVFKGGSF